MSGTWRATTACVALAFAMADAALAQDAPPAPATAAAATAESSGGLEDILVTAQRRSESVQDVPIAISAFSTDELAQRGITSTLQIIGQVPNLFGSNNTGLGSANAYYLRGLGNTETIATFDPPVGTYVDDIYLSRQNANNFSFFDLERIEVLRGPQGTLFGRNTTGGAINVILKRPAEEIAGYAEAAYGRYDRVLLRGSIDLPLGDKAGIKLSGYYQDDKGYARNTTTGERTNDSDLAGLRLGARFDITEDVKWYGSVAYMRNDGENLLNFECDPRDPSNCGGRFVTTGLLKSYGTAATPSPFVGLGVTGRKAGYGLGNETDTLILTSNLEWSGENHTLNLITGYVDLKQQFALDFADGRGLPNVTNPNPAVTGYTLGGFTILNDGKHQQFTQEIKLNGNLFGGFLDYVAGVYFYDEDNNTDFADIFTLGLAPPPRGFPLLLADRTLINSTEAIAGYVQVDANIGEQFKLTAGVRYTDEEKTFDIIDQRAICGASPRPATCLGGTNLFVALPGGNVPIPTKQTTRIWTPRFAANFEPSDDVLIFASATRGFKSGGWNARGTANNTLLPFDPEKVWSYEVGAKTQFFDDRLRANITGFYLDATALQTPSAFVDPVSGGVTFITQNFADYENKGIEIELTAAPVDGLNLYVNFGYQDDEYKVSDTLLPNEFGVRSVRAQQALCLSQLAAGRVPLATGANNAPDCAAGIITAEGGIAEPVRTPEFSLALGGTYDFPIPSAGIVIQPSVNAVYRSSLETGTANATIFTGSITAPSGAVFPTNPFAGDFVTGSQTDSYWQINAALTLKTDDDNWRLSLECENCFDETYNQSSLVNYTYISPPMTWTVRALRRF